VARVLLHSLVFAPDGVSTAYLMTDLARGLQRLGHEVTVLTTTPHYNLDPSAVARQPMVADSGLLRSSCDGITVWHVPMPMKGQRVGARMFDYLRFHLRTLAASRRVLGAYDVVLAPSPPLTIGAVAWVLARRRGAKSVYNVQEIYPDFAVNNGLIRNRAFIAALRLLERFVYARSAAVVPISEWFGRTIAPRGDAAHKLRVIPNFVDTELYRPGPRDNDFAVEHGLTDDFVVLYGGNIGLSQDWDSWLYAAEALAHLPIRFVAVGDGVRGEWLRAQVARRRLANALVLGYQPRELMPMINAASDVGTIPMKATTTRDTFPSKIYTILACAKPAVVSADADSELAWVIEQAGCGRVVPPERPEAYAQALLQAYLGREGLLAEGERGRAFVEREYSKEAVARKYDALVRELVAA
jgi:colanic acid biosynthesis glycosyl transferase WcaI